MMNPLNASWSVLKNVGSADDFGDVSTSLDEEQQQKIEAIKRKNEEARKRMMQIKPLSNSQLQEAAQHLRNNPPPRPPMLRPGTTDARQQARLEQAKQPVEIANIMDSPERIRELNPNVNFADGSAPPVPQNNPNPLNLSMESLKRLNEGR